LAGRIVEKHSHNTFADTADAGKVVINVTSYAGYTINAEQTTWSAAEAR